MHKVQADTTEVTLWTASDSFERCAKGRAGLTLPIEDRDDNDKVAQRMGELLQSDLDVRIPLADLPADDPDKSTDPDREDLFWDGTDLVGRSELVSVVWDAPVFSPTIRRTTSKKRA